MKIKTVTQIIRPYILVPLLILASCSSSNRSTTKEFKPDNPVSQQIYTEAKIMSSTAFSHFQAGRYNQAIKSYLDAISKFTLIDNHQEIAKLFNNIGSIYINVGNLTQALIYIKKSYRINQKYNLYPEMASNLSTLGQLQEYKKNYTLALSRYRAALDIFLRLPNQMDQVADQYKNIGYIYYKTKEYTNALLALKKSLQINILLKEYAEVAENYTYIGQIFIAQKAYKNALLYFKNALNADKAMENSANIAADLKNIGYAYELLKELNNALTYYERASKINAVLKRPHRLLKDLKNIHRIHIKLANKIKAAAINRWIQKLKQALKNKK